MIYIFTCIRAEIRHTYDLDLSRDLDARKLASENQTCLKVETQSGRVVWRKPLSQAEFRDVMAGVRSGTRMPKETIK